MCKLFMIHIDNVAKFEIQIQIKVVKYCNTLVWHDKIFIIFCEIPQGLMFRYVYGPRCIQFHICSSLRHYEAHVCVLNKIL